jgi:hypothetical protein
MPWDAFEIEIGLSLPDGRNRGDRELLRPNQCAQSRGRCQFMKKRDYQKCLRAFVTEIKGLQSPAFVKPDQWVLSTEILNAVVIGYEIESFADRKKLHEVGRKHGLIPLCPSDVVDLEAINGSMRSVVRTPRGLLEIAPPP